MAPAAPATTLKKAPKASAGPPSNRGGTSDRKAKSGSKKNPKERKMHFTVPDGVQPGETLKLMTPRGGEVEV